MGGYSVPATSYARPASSLGVGGGGGGVVVGAGAGGAGVGFLTPTTGSRYGGGASSSMSFVAPPPTHTTHTHGYHGYHGYHGSGGDYGTLYGPGGPGGPGGGPRGASSSSPSVISQGLIAARAEADRVVRDAEVKGREAAARLTRAFATFEAKKENTAGIQA